MTPTPKARSALMEEDVITLVVVKALSLKHRVERCVYSEDGKRIAACMGDFSLRVYEIVDCAADKSSAHAAPPGSPAQNSSYTLQNLCTLKGHSSNVWDINFSQDTHLLCSASSDKTVRVWQLAKQENLFTFTQHSDIAWCCSFVPYHPHLVASGSSDKTVKIWNYSTGEIMHDLHLYGDAVETLSFSKDGTKLCTGSRDGKVVLWSDIFSEPVYSVLYETDEWIRFVSFSESDNDLLITSGSSNKVLVWDVKDVTFTSSVAESLDSVSKTAHFAETTEAPTEGLKPKIELQGHLNTVWNSCFALINYSHSENIRSLVISCSGDRSLR